MGKFDDLTDRVFGRLTVLAQAGRDRHGNVLWACRCECGQTPTVVRGSLVTGGSRSCGCLNAESRRRPRPSLAERFAAMVDKNGPVPPHRPELGPCHIWTGYRNERGYGQVGLERSRKCALAHRVAFLLAHGRWPESLGLHHCDNPACVKAVADDQGPAHIFEGTLKDNAVDMVAKKRMPVQSRTHCKNGHPYDTTRNGARSCSICNRAYRRRWRQQRAARGISD